MIEPITPSRSVALALAAGLGLSESATDRFLFAAGLAPETDWQARAEDAERRLEAIRAAIADADEEPPFIRRRTG